MKTIRNTLALIFILFLTASVTGGQEKPALTRVDRIRLAEAFSLGEKLEDKLWAGWSQAPFAVLLVTPDKEFLIRHPGPTDDFTSIGYDPVLRSDVYYRDRKFAPNLLATFPAVGGISTIVIGQAENTNSKTSTEWVVTLLHEHFHQLQDSQPGMYKETEALNLSRGDQTGMWMLNYPFPYTSSEVGQHFSLLATRLVEAMEVRPKAQFPSKLASYLEARKALKNALAADDYKYLSFQLWKEGIARYTEYRVAQWAASNYQPGREFRELKDYTTFATVADRIRQGIVSQLSTLKLESSKRIAFYPLGAAEGLLLDRANPQWRRSYFSEKFDNEKYFTRKSQ